MNILSQFNQFVEKTFNTFLKNYFSTNNYLFKTSDFNNYISFIQNLDSFSTSLSSHIISSYFEYIDNVFFNSSYRKKFCISKGFYYRKNYVTMFGEITFKRRYYFDTNTNEHFFFTDLFLALPKRKHFDPFVCAEIVDKSSYNSYSKAGILTADKIGSRINNNISISRATARNIVMAFNPCVDEKLEEKRIERLFVMLDEKFVPSQFNKKKEHMIKAAVIFEDTKLVYKTKKKQNSMDRYQLINSHTCANTSSVLDLQTSVYDYIYFHYDTENLKEIYFMGDCASWIKSFTKNGFFQYNNNINISFSMDGFHFSQALQRLVGNNNSHWYNALKLAVKRNNKKLFISLCEKFISENKIREIKIRSLMKYILNNWKERQLYQNKTFLKCSMESHISHIFADLFTSRPKAYSKKGINKLLNIRLLKVNGYNLKEIYLNSINKQLVNNTAFSYNLSMSGHMNLNLDFKSKDKYNVEYQVGPLLKNLKSDNIINSI